MLQAPGGTVGRMLRAPGALGRGCRHLGAVARMLRVPGGTVGRMLRALGGAVLSAGIRALEGELRLPSGLPARKNDACLRFDPAGGSSLKSRNPSTCGFVNASCPDTEPARLKRKHAGFFGPRRSAGNTNRARKQRKAPGATGRPNRARRLGFGRACLFRGVYQVFACPNRVGCLGLSRVAPGARRCPNRAGCLELGRETPGARGFPIASGA